MCGSVATSPEPDGDGVRTRVGRARIEMGTDLWRNTYGTSESKPEPPTDIRFFVDCDPPKVSHHDKKLGTFTARGKAPRASMRDSERLVVAKAYLTELLRPYAPPVPVQGAVTCVVSWTWPWLKKHTPVQRANGCIVNDDTPDLSNVWKTLEDVLKRLRFFEDDRKVVFTQTSKFYGNRPGISVRVRKF